ncbi:S66 family peptidase [Viridibacillus arvi]|uniref:S66 family peptidase n=1 Tax=Viridibacillus arvi TaxID=263475 RepID=UPI002480F4E0|nr:S66 peptidase family protein [Viridibacillus arvi]
MAPSSGIAADCPGRLQRGIEEIEKLGYKVVVGEYARKSDDYMAGTVDERLIDLHAMFSNPKIDAIITTIGGTCSHQLLDKIDYELIKNNPKIFMGYSDITALNSAIYEKTGLVTFLGPAVLPQFGEFNGLMDYTYKYFQNTLVEVNTVEINSSSYRVLESLSWDKKDTRERVKEFNTGMQIFKQGKAKGKIIAGNVGVMLLLAGTEYFPNVDGAILCLEDDEGECPESIDRYFTQLRHMRVFDKISALVIGRFHPSVGFGDNHDNGLLYSILQRATEGYDFPIVYNADFGHTDPMFILPNGIQASIQANKDGIEFRFLETAVQ